MSSPGHGSRGAAGRHRWLIIGAVAMAAVVGLAVALVEATGGHGAHQGQPRSSITVPPSSAGTASTAVQTGRAVQTSRAGQATGLAACARPGQSALSGGWSLIATTRGAIPRYASPGGPQDGTIPGSWYGAVSSLAVLAQKPGWLEVRLAGRPNGSTGWVRQADVSVTATPYWISVDLATRHVTLFRLDQQVLDAPAGVGTGQDPTPTGQYFVAFFEASPSAGYGPFILVTSAHSESIANWEGSGDAVIGIHGPLGADSLIGTTGAYLSHGCIRLPIPDLVQLRDVPAGSPISICD
jgi:lipoprotein-anchoring transpeptidase ErfK/SrfK